MKTNAKQIARYEKLLQTLQRTETLLTGTDTRDGGKVIERTRANIDTVKYLLSTLTQAAAE